MGWIFCMLLTAAGLAFFRIGWKSTKIRGIAYGMAAVLLLLSVALVALLFYRHQNITEPIQTSELFQADELTVTLRGITEKNDYRAGCFTILYQNVRNYLDSALYLPCLDQETFDAGEKSVTLRYGNETEAGEAEVKLTLTFYENRNICLVNGKKMYFAPKEGRGHEGYQKIEELFAFGSYRTELKVLKTDLEQDTLMAVDENGSRYWFSKVSEKLRTRAEEKMNLTAVSAGDVLVILSDGNTLMGDPYQIEHVYKIYVER